MKHSVLIAILALSVSSFGTWINEGGTEATLQEVLDYYTVGGPSSIDVSDESQQIAQDSVWRIDASGGMASTFLIELVHTQNQGVVQTSPVVQTFGIYDRQNISNQLVIFDNSNTSVSTPAGDRNNTVTLEVASNSVGTWFTVDGWATNQAFSSENFGFFYTNWYGNPRTYYSNPELNDVDRMVAFQGNDVDLLALPGIPAGTLGSNEYILGWDGGRDMDFNDYVVLVESVRPVPEPASLGLMGLGILGLLGMAHRRKK